jgi:trans-aconitate methyltransferase
VTTYNKLGGNVVMKETMFIMQMEEDAIEVDWKKATSLTPIGIPLKQAQIPTPCTTIKP